MTTTNPAFATGTLHPQAAAHLAAAAGAAGVASMSVAEARSAALAYLPLQAPPPAMTVVEHRFVPGPTADLPVRILRPRLTTTPRPAIVVLHGSGWVIGNLDLVDEPARRLALDTGLPVITVNYQKAPEHPFPVPLEDAIAAVTWVHDHADELGLDPARLAVVGDSAGAATHHLVRHGVPIAAQALLYPALDHRRDTASYCEFAHGFGLDADDMAWFWHHYLGGGTGTDDVRAEARISPLLAEDLHGLPPTFVATAGHDVLRDEGEAYADRLRASGVAVTARRYDGMIHGFWWMDGILDDARTLQLDLAAFLGRL